MNSYRRNRIILGPHSVPNICHVADTVHAKLIPDSKSLRGSSATFAPWLMLENFSDNPIPQPISWPSKTFLTQSELEKLREYLDSIFQNNGFLYSHEDNQFQVYTDSSSKIDNFNNRNSDALQSLRALLPWSIPLLEKLVQQIVPISVPQPAPPTTGMSAMWLKGMLFFDIEQKVDPKTILENIFHELGHQILMTYQLTDPILNNLPTQFAYSGIRNQHRPGILALHGAMALAFMKIVSDAQSRPQRSFILSTLLNKTLTSLSGLDFTPLGKMILDELQEFANETHIH